MEFCTDYRTEEYILKTTWEDFPEDVKERALRCSIDLMGALILGSQGKQFSVGCSLADQMGMKGDILIPGSRQGKNLLGAVVSLGHASNSFDIDDGYNMIKGHPGTSFVAGVLATALQQNCTYAEYLTALVVCYEITIRWGLAMQEHYQFLHSTGTYGAFGTAAGMGRLLRLTPDQMNNALSIADFHAPLTPVMRAVEYPSMNKDGVPFGALVGAMAVLETQLGETGRTHLLELPENRHYLDSLGERYYIRELYFKPNTCCRWAHQPIRACQVLMSEHGVCADDISKVIVHTFSAAAKLSKIVPHNTDEAQYNIAYPVACAVVHGEVGYDQIKDEALSDERVLKMMEKLDFVVDPEMEKEFPEKRLAWVEMQLMNGSIIKSPIYAAPGEHTDPELNFDWIIRKFRRIVSPVIALEGCEKILDILSRYSDVPMRDIVSVVNGCLFNSAGKGA